MRKFFIEKRGNQKFNTINISVVKRSNKLQANVGRVYSSDLYGGAAQRSTPELMCFCVCGGGAAASARQIADANPRLRRLDWSANLSAAQITNVRCRLLSAF